MRNPLVFPSASLRNHFGKVWEKHFGKLDYLDTVLIIHRMKDQCEKCFCEGIKVLSVVSGAQRPSSLLGEPSQLPSQLLTAVLNRQLMCSKMFLPLLGLTHTHSSLTAYSHTEHTDPFVPNSHPSTQRNPKKAYFENQDLQAFT